MDEIGQMSAKEHHQQKITQIFLPLILSFLLLAVAATFIFSGIADETLDHRVWGNISAILILLPVLLFLVFDLILLFFFIFLAGKTHHILALKLPRVNSFVEKITRIITRTSQSSVKPVIFGESVLAALACKSKKTKEQENNG